MPIKGPSENETVNAVRAAVRAISPNFGRTIEPGGDDTIAAHLARGAALAKAARYGLCKPNPIPPRPSK